MVELISPPQDLTVATTARTTRFAVPRDAHRSRSDPPAIAFRADAARVHRIPTHVRDDARPPLVPGRDGRKARSDLPDGESDLFFARQLDDPNHVGMSREIDRYAQSFSRRGLPNGRRVDLHWRRPSATRRQQTRACSVNHRTASSFGQTAHRADIAERPSLPPMGHAPHG